MAWKFGCCYFMDLCDSYWKKAKFAKQEACLPVGAPSPLPIKKNVPRVEQGKPQSINVRAE